MVRGLIHIYTGRGKGKTTAALGLILRAYGAGKKVCLLQFMKCTHGCELYPLKKLGIDTISFKQRHPMFYPKASLRTLKEKATKDIARARTILVSGGYDLVVLDEILCLLGKGLMHEQDIVDIIDIKPAATELVLTGYKTTRTLIRKADYVSTIAATKHPFKRGIKARRAIEF